MVRIAMIGIGGFGWDLLRWLKEMTSAGRCRVVAAADSRLAELQDRADELSNANVDLFDDGIEMMDAMRGRCDCVYIATSIASHEPLVLAAARRGYHIHVEKPPAATVQEVDRMIRAVDQAGVCCMVGFQAVHSNHMQFIKDRIVAGRLGAVRTLTCRAGWPRHPSYYQRNQWAGRLRAGDRWVLDGPANNALAHQITNMLLLASPIAGGFATPTAVRGELYVAGERDSHDTAAIAFETAEGPVCRFLASHCSESLFHPTIDVACEGGKASWTMGKGKCAQITYADGSSESCPDGQARQSQAMMENFLDAIDNAAPSLLRCTLNDARKMTLVIDGAHESSGRIHRIDERFVRIIDKGGEGEHTVVDGIDKVINETATAEGLFSDLPDAPAWAVGTDRWDMTGYEQFPRRFLQSTNPDIS